MPIPKPKKTTTTTYMLADKDIKEALRNYVGITDGSGSVTVWNSDDSYGYYLVAEIRVVESK